MKFLCDEMLGRLAKWLRVMGYDVLYLKNVEDEKIVENAIKEDRILLTRDKKLAKKFKNSLYIEEKDLDGQIRKVVEAFEITKNEENFLSRCIICNVEIEEIEKEKVKGKVPENVFENFEEFWICKKCGRIYWAGTHWKNMKEKMEKIK
ncbi:MAG: Mut7-C RNAse domain-containing protein [Thermoplasmatales archaeon]|nr:Mut7-C RNAse domain-containing protein [Thermoplasmatales archaeon]